MKKSSAMFIGFAFGAAISILIFFVFASKNYSSSSWSLIAFTAGIATIIAGTIDIRFFGSIGKWRSFTNYPVDKPYCCVSHTINKFNASKTFISRPLTKNHNDPKSKGIDADAGTSRCHKKQSKLCH